VKEGVLEAPPVGSKRPWHPNRASFPSARRAFSTSCSLTLEDRNEASTREGRGPRGEHRGSRAGVGAGGSCWGGGGLPLRCAGGRYPLGMGRRGEDEVAGTRHWPFVPGQAVKESCPLRCVAVALLDNDCGNVELHRGKGGRGARACWVHTGSMCLHHMRAMVHMSPVKPECTYLVSECTYSTVSYTPGALWVPPLEKKKAPCISLEPLAIVQVFTLSLSSRCNPKLPASLFHPPPNAP